MDRNEIVFLAGLTVCVLGFGAFVVWGPKVSQRKRGALVGLQNLGLTCFLNALLQALASCPLFVKWLEDSADLDQSIACSLLVVLQVLGSESATEETVSPIRLLGALRGRGWHVTGTEQDVHELFHCLVTALEEEAHKAAIMSNGSLADALDHHMPSRAGAEDDAAAEACPMEAKGCFDCSGGDAIANGKPLAYCVEEKLGAKRRVQWLDINRNPRPSPFRGLLTSQLCCTACGFKSVLRYDKFDSISLHLPPMRGQHTLQALLDRYVRTETVADVACDGCNANRGESANDDPPLTAPALKSLTIGKLPHCLCLHVPRTHVSNDGVEYKREDYVDFPEFLSMDAYTYTRQLERNRLSSTSDETHNRGDSKQNGNGVVPEQWSRLHMYRLKSVTVHSGLLHGGHFVTYRRGPLRSSTRHRSKLTQLHVQQRWYYTSDADVRESSLAEALQAKAYMIFYEKVSNT